MVEILASKYDRKKCLVSNKKLVLAGLFLWSYLQFVSAYQKRRNQARVSRKPEKKKILKRHILSKSPLRDLERPYVKFIRAARAFALYGKVLFCTYSTQNNFPIARKFL